MAAMPMHVTRPVHPSPVSIRLEGDWLKLIGRGRTLAFPIRPRP